MVIISYFVSTYISHKNRFHKDTLYTDNSYS